MSTLLVILPLAMPGPDTEFDYVLTIDGQHIAHQGQAAAGLLPPLPGAGHEIVAVVPAQALSWHRVDLPKTLLNKSSLPRGGQSAQLRAALEGLLEDQLLDEPASLHFALAPGPAGEQAPWVAVCDRAWLHACLQLLEQAQRPVSRIVPEFAPLAAAAAAPTLYATAGPQAAQLVVAGAQGVSLLPLGAAAAKLLAWPESGAFMAEPGVASQAEPLFRRSVQLQAPALRWMQSARSDWNLAQFDLATSSRTRALKTLVRSWEHLRYAPQWRAARWMLALLLASQLVGLNALAWRESAVLDQKQAAIRGTLLQTFPDIKVVLDASLQMEREVRALQQATGAVSARDLEAMLGVLSAVAPVNQVLNEIDFSAGEARFKGWHLSPDDISQLQAQLRSKGYAMRMEGDGLVMSSAESAP